jgi:hypothetical protein
VEHIIARNKQDIDYSKIRPVEHMFTIPEIKLQLFLKYAISLPKCYIKDTRLLGFERRLILTIVKTQSI